MNNNKNANQTNLSSHFLKFLSLCALMTSTTGAIEQLPSRQELSFVNEQQSGSQYSTNYPSIENRKALIEEIDLKREWEALFGDDPREDLLAYDYSLRGY